jgi:hypothetical protein
LIILNGGAVVAMLTFLGHLVASDDNVSKLGTEPHTPLDDAIKATLASLGCLTA